jgi:hypothetical protein
MWRFHQENQAWNIYRKICVDPDGQYGAMRKMESVQWEITKNDTNFKLFTRKAFLSGNDWALSDHRLIQRYLLTGVFTHVWITRDDRRTTGSLCVRMTNLWRMTSLWRDCSDEPVSAFFIVIGSGQVIFIEWSQCVSNSRVALRDYWSRQKWSPNSNWSD